MSRTRNGKIARLPFLVREEVNQRLRDNQTGTEILAWLNDKHLATGSEPFNAENLSNWREGGFADWLADESRVENTRKLGETCFRLAQAAGHSITDGAAAIAGGKILECLEAGVALDSGDDEDGGGKGMLLTDLVISLAKLRDSEAKMMVARAIPEQLRQREEAHKLNREKFEVSTCEKFIKFVEDAQAVKIATSNAKSDVKIAQLRQLMFGPIEEGAAA